MRGTLLTTYILSAVMAFANDTPQVSMQSAVYSAPCEHVSQISLFYSTSQAAMSSVLVLINYHLGDFNAEDQIVQTSIEDWAKVSAYQHLAFVYADVCGDPILTKGIRLADEDLTHALNKALIDKITKALGVQVPFFAIPYDEDEITSAYVIDLAIQRPDQIMAWGLTNYVPTVEFSPHSPGIMAASDDFIDYPAQQAFYTEQRRKSREINWLGFKPTDKEKCKEFICQFFQQVPTSSDGIWFDIESKSLLESTDDATVNPKATWLPSSSVANSWKTLETPALPRPTLIEKVVDPEEPGMVPLHLFLRLPPGVTDGSALSGVLAYCTWDWDTDRIRKQLLLDTNRTGQETQLTAVEMMRYASEHNLAVLTWTTPGDWNAKTNTENLSHNAQAEINREFNIYAKTWNRGVEEYVNEYNIPPDDWLLYGFSRGGQWAHRLALREPERFWAINIHVSSSYDVPTPNGAQCLWLITTGDKEHGYSSAQTFYHECEQLNYPIIFKAEENLGHSTCIEVEQLRDTFFDYALQLCKEKNDNGISKQDMAATVFQRWATAPIIGDYLNQEIFSASQAPYIPESQKVYLPNEAIAEAWAKCHVITSEDK